MRALLIDVYEPKVTVVEVDCLDDYLNYIYCDCIDVTVRQVGSSVVHIVCDDVGALTSKPIISASDMDGDNIYGNILIFSGELIGDGFFQSLSADEMQDVLNNIVFAKSVTSSYDDFHFVLRFNPSC